MTDQQIRIAGWFYRGLAVGFLIGLAFPLLVFSL